MPQSCLRPPEGVNSRLVIIVSMEQEKSNVIIKNRKYSTYQDYAPARLETLDLVRGLTLVSMILYHGLWDFLYLSEAGRGLPSLRFWYEGTGGHLWQQSICRTFILLSGFCVPFSKHIIRRGLQVSLAGCAVSAVTLMFLYEERVVFGVLTFLGMAMLLTGVLKETAGRKDGFFHTMAQNHPKPVYTAGLLVCALLFHVTRWVNDGYLRMGPVMWPAFPAALYKDGPSGLVLTALGFPMPGFFSTDYFSLIPWIFLFWTGMFLHLLLDACGRDVSWKTMDVFHLNVPVLNWMGRHSLLVYLMHQPLLYLFTVCF